MKQLKNNKMKNQIISEIVKDGINYNNQIISELQTELSKSKTMKEEIRLELKIESYQKELKIIKSYI